ncbi:transcriptional coactivator p15/PC4 family protein [Planktomarina sp.]|jgi:hypothetical protein|uniref:transcriptional coactivator p15/PC4 family protein n=1 Tax=Planktomarina sp. TaxID=2024851 RepID=UPI00326038CE
MMEAYSKIIVSEPYRQVRLTVNEFREEEYLHFREYYLDFEEEWKPSNKGLSIPLEVETSKELFIAMAEILSLAESKQVLEEHFGETIRDLYQK